MSTWFPYFLTSRLKKSGHEDIPNHYARWKWTKEVIAARIGETMLFVRPGMEGDLERMGNLRGSVLIYSLWEGYREDDRTKKLLDKVESLGITSAFEGVAVAVIPCGPQMREPMPPSVGQDALPPVLTGATRRGGRARRA